MKTPIPILFSIALLAVSPAIAQETAGVAPATGQPFDTVTEPETNPSLSDDFDEAPLGNRTFIPHALEVRPFTPPPPPVVKRLPAVRVDAAVSLGRFCRYWHFLHLLEHPVRHSNHISRSGWSGRDEVK